MARTSLNIKAVYVPSDADSLFDAPPRPFPRNLSRAVSGILSEFPQVLEAHLPECFIPGVMEAPATILVLVVTSLADRRELVQRIAPLLAEVLPSGLNLDLWTLDEADRRIRAVRKAESEIHPVRISETWWPFAH